MNPKIPEIFKLEDFDSPIVAIKAQQIFETWLEENCKMVYGYKSLVGGLFIYSEQLELGDTRAAYLIASTEIKKEKCAHKNISSCFYPTRSLFLCSDCHKKLTPTWQEAE